MILKHHRQQICCQTFGLQRFSPMIGQTDELESLELALADVEILCSAYPDETKDVTLEQTSSQFPLHLILHFSETAYIQIEWVQGYPVKSNIQVATYRSKPLEYARLERAVKELRMAAELCLLEGVEGGLACCAAAFYAWNSDTTDSFDEMNLSLDSTSVPLVTAATSHCSGSHQHQHKQSLKSNLQTYSWNSGNPLIDRKSTFIAHACRIAAESEVQPALQQLLNSHSKFQRATHNMVLRKPTVVAIFTC